MSTAGMISETSDEKRGKSLNCAQMSSVKKKGKEKNDSLPHGWIKVSSKRYPNKFYFYNTITKTSSWEDPCKVSEIGSKDSSSKPSVVNKKDVKKSNNLTSSSKSKIIQKKDGDKKISFTISLKSNPKAENFSGQKNRIPSNVFIGLHKVSKKSKTDSASLSESVLPKSSNSKNDESISNLEKDAKKKCLGVSSGQTVKMPWNFNLEKSNCNKSVEKEEFIKKTKTKSEDDAYSQIISHERSSSTVSQVTSEEKTLPFNGSIKIKKKKKKKKKELEKDDKASLLKITKEKNDHLKKCRTKFIKHKTPDGDIETEKKDVPSCISENKFCENIESKNVDQSCFEVESVDWNNGMDNKLNNNSRADFCEEMDWEPCDEELDAKNLKKVCLQVNAAKKKVNNIYCGQNLEYEKLSVPFRSNSGILVLDTNILISCLNFVKELRDSNIFLLGYPILYVPWRVLQELDHLKDSKINSGNEQLHVNVRKAISYLNDNFKGNHPRFCGQSFEEFSKIKNENCTSDDEILQTCLQLKTLHRDKKVILMTNDKNLESKAIVSSVESYSKETFQTKFLLPSDNSSCLVNFVKENNDDAEQIDSVVCELKFILKELVGLLVETEMRIAFDEDWIKICYKKPPWTLMDTLNCFTKHWRSVFFLVFSKEVLSGIEELNSKLFKTEIGNNRGALRDALSAAQNLVKHIKISQKANRTYKESVDSALHKISDLLKKVNSDDSQVSNNSMVQAQSELTSSTAIDGEPDGKNQASIEEDFNLVKDLFRYIWDSLRDFCGNLSQMIYTPGTNNLSKTETKLNLMERNNDVASFVAILEKILESKADEISEFHPVIHHLSNFLKKFLPFMDATLQIKLPKYLALFFSHSEGRKLLGTSLNDFREFSQSLLKACEFMEKTFCT